MMAINDVVTCFTVWKVYLYLLVLLNIAILQKLAHIESALDNIAIVLTL